MSYDPWASYNSGMQTLGQTFDTMREEQRQAPLRALQLRILQQKADEGDLALQQAQITAADKLALRKKLMTALPTTTTTGGYSLDTSPQTRNAAELMRNGASFIPQPAPNVNYTAVPSGPDLADLSASNATLNAPTQPATPLVQPNLATGTEVPQQTITVKPDLAAIAREELLKQGNIEEAAKAGQAQLQSMNVDEKLAEMKAKVLAGGGDPVQYAQAKMQLDLGKEIIGTVAPLMKTQQGRAMAQSLLDGYKKAYPNVQAIQGMNLDNFATGPQGDVYNVHDPQNGQLIGHYVRDPETGALKFEKSSAGEYANTDFGTFKNGFKQEHPNASDADVSRAWETKKLAYAKAQRQIIVNNPSTGGANATTPATAANAGPINEQGVNPAALNGLDPGRQALIKKIANYEFAIPNPRSKEGIALAARVALYDPSYDMQLYPIRQALRKSFTSGADAKNITSLNTAVHHLDQLASSVDKLNNSNMPAWNFIANKFETAIGDPKLTRVINDLNAVKNELSTTFKGTGATDQEIAAWSQGFSTSGSPAQLKEAGVKEATKLLQGRLDALIDKYQTGMGNTRDLQILSPKSIATLQKLGVNVDRYKAYEKGGSSQTIQGKPSLDQIFK